MQNSEEMTAAEQVYAERARVAAGVAAFKNIDPVRLPVLTALVNSIDILRISSALLPLGAPRDGMCIPLPSGVGKSTVAKMVRRSVAGRAGKSEDEGPVLIVELDVEETISLWSSILQALGDPYWAEGYPKNLKKRALSYLRKRGVELIIVDEFNHCVDRGQAHLLMNTVKQLLNAGIAPVVVMGTDEEVEKLPKLDAFERRMVHAPVIGPLQWGDGEHKRNWKGFLQGLDEQIKGNDILPGLSRLHETALAKALCEACDGVVGYVHWVVQDALTEVLKRGGSSIERIDLATSVNRLFVKFKLYGRINAVEGLL